MQGYARNKGVTILHHNIVWMEMPHARILYDRAPRTSSLSSRPASHSGARFRSSSNNSPIVWGDLFDLRTYAGAVHILSFDGKRLPDVKGWNSVPDDRGVETLPEEIKRFKQMDNAVLFAAGSCWEGVDFPGRFARAGNIAWWSWDHVCLGTWLY